MKLNKIQNIIEKQKSFESNPENEGRDKYLEKSVRTMKTEKLPSRISKYN